MAHAENTVTINQPIDQVFAYLADGTNNPNWRSGVLEIERTSPDGGDGAVYRQVLQGPGGRKIAGDYRITAFDPPHRIAFQVIAGPARPTGRFDLVAGDANHTTVTFSLDARPRGLMWLMAGMLARQMRVEVGQLDHLKTVLET